MLKPVAAKETPPMLAFPLADCRFAEVFPGFFTFNPFVPMRFLFTCGEKTHLRNLAGSGEYYHQLSLPTDVIPFTGKSIRIPLTMKT